MDTLTLSQWLLLTGICLAGAMTPGISLAVITRHTLLGGHRAGVLAALTHALAVGLWALATVTGLALLFASHPRIEQAFSLLGALFLLYLAGKSWQASGQPLPEVDGQRTLHSAARDGFMVAFINPKVALFFVALFSQFLHAQLGSVARGQMVAIAALVDGSWYALVAVLLGRSRLLPWLRAHHHYVERATALLLVLVASTVLLNAAQ